MSENSTGLTDEIHSYYFSFARTGVAEIDAVLEAIANAGSGFHSTDEWASRDYGESHIDRIQAAAQSASSELTRLQQELSAAKRERDEARAKNDRWQAEMDKANKVVLENFKARRDLDASIEQARLSGFREGMTAAAVFVGKRAHMSELQDASTTVATTLRYLEAGLQEQARAAIASMTGGEG